MTTYTNHAKTSSAKRNSSWKPKLNKRDCLTLKKIGSKNHRRWQQNLIFILKTISTKSLTGASQIQNPW
jgi:hypothetical protein